MPAATAACCYGHFACDPLGPVDVQSVAEWVSSIGFEEWPQQHRLPDRQIRPAMVTDLAWHGFGAVTDALVAAVMSEHFPDATSYQRMLSVVMPGHHIDPHVDQHVPGWLCRVHVPLRTNPRSWFVIEGERHNLYEGSAYRFNTQLEHEVFNDGDSPRIHLMFDVRR